MLLLILYSYFDLYLLKLKESSEWENIYYLLALIEETCYGESFRIDLTGIELLFAVTILVS